MPAIRSLRGLVQFCQHNLKIAVCPDTEAEIKDERGSFGSFGRVDGD